MKVNDFPGEVSGTYKAPENSGNRKKSDLFAD
jgi:hypothetical protein